MDRLRQFGALFAVVCTLGGVGVANASAAEFTATKTGSLAGSNLAKQTWTFNAGLVKCTEASVAGNVSAKSFTDLHITVTYSNCTAFGLPNVHVSLGTYSMTANGENHIIETLTIKVTKTVLTPECTITISPQTNKSLEFTNYGSDMTAAFSLTGIAYTSSGGPCGSSGTTGTFGGTIRVGVDGTLSYDP